MKPSKLDRGSPLDLASAAGRQPPYSEEAEQAVLGAMLFDADAGIKAAELLDAQAFYRPAHRAIFEAILTLIEQGTVVDPIAVTEQLKRQGALEAAGGGRYVAWLSESVPTAANVAYHAQLVREKALFRHLIEITTSVASEAYEGKLSADALMDAAESQIFKLGQDRTGDGFVPIRSLLWPAMEKIETVMQAGTPITGVASGFVDLDKLTTGFQPKQLIIIAARPAMGKTALVLNIAQHAAITDRVPVAFFSLEMGREELVMRLLTSEARVDAQAVRQGRIKDHEFTRLGQAAATLAQAPLFIDDTPGITLMEVRSRARRLKAEHGLGLIIVDYLQLMSAPGAESRQNEVSMISRGLKGLSKELEVPVVALSQLSRQTENRSGEDKRPQLADLRESGAIEQDADVIMFLYRPEYYAEKAEDGKSPKDPELDGKAEVILGKQRSGPVGTVILHFAKQFTRFENVLRHKVSGQSEYGGGDGGEA